MEINGFFFKWKKVSNELIFFSYLDLKNVIDSNVCVFVGVFHECDQMGGKNFLLMKKKKLNSTGFFFKKTKEILESKYLPYKCLFVVLRREKFS